MVNHVQDCGNPIHRISEIPPLFSMVALRFVLLVALCVGVLSKIDRLEADMEGAFIAAAV